MEKWHMQIYHFPPLRGSIHYNIFITRQEKEKPVLYLFWVRTAHEGQKVAGLIVEFFLVEQQICSCLPLTHWHEWVGHARVTVSRGFPGARVCWLSHCLAPQPPQHGCTVRRQHHQCASFPTSPPSTRYALHLLHMQFYLLSLHSSLTISWKEVEVNRFLSIMGAERYLYYSPFYFHTTPLPF